MASREYPKTWGKFERITEDGKTLSFVIEDIPEDLWPTAIEFMLGNYIREDVWWTTAGTAEDPQAIEEYRVLWTSIVKLKMSLACFLLDSEGTERTLVGVNLCMPQEKGHFVEHKPPKTQAGLLSLCMFSEAMKVTAIYDKYDVSKYLMGAGLSVSTEYRGLGVAVELLKCRKLLAKEEGLNVTGGIFTSASAQRSAEKADMESIYEVPYKEFGDQCNINFNTNTENLKIFAARVE
uniref:CRAL-TRIO domain-containing protein n=1 Tax=Heliconius melpomene TaxID=34740 RepID=A0A2H4RMW2_HELME|nr:CRAL-TRIO domain-containing protein [Heliconius melpomene]